MIMTGLARIGVLSTGKIGLILSLASFYILFWMWLPGTLAQDMEGELESLDQSGISETEQPETPRVLERRAERPTFRGQLDRFARSGTAESKIKVAAGDILSAIAAGRDIDIEYADIDGDLNIGRIADKLQRDETGKPVIRGNIGIRNCTLGGYTFSSATFKGNSIFSRTIFTGYTEFIGTDFSKYADFSGATFNGDVEFVDAIFGGNAHFISTTFKGDASFKYAKFSGEGSFRNTIFSKNVDFTDATMSGATDFIGATFTEESRFLRTYLERPASFQGVSIRENTVAAGFWNNVLRKVLRFLPERTITDFSQLDTGSIMDGSSNPFLKRYIDDEQWIKSWRESIWWREYVFILWEVTSHCGRSIGLWGFWSAVIAIVFAVIYSRFLSDSIAFSVDRLAGVKPGFKGYLYYSIVTLTTLGYGDIVPLTNRARLAVGTEVGLGYIMLGGLVSIFANKMASRS